jgi:hypothetical protein
MQRQLADIDAYLMRAMQPYAWAHSLLQTIPGIDEVAAALILIEIGDDMARFASPERLACWAALSPGNHESAGKRKVRPHAARQQRHPPHPVRVRQCRAHDQEHFGGKVQEPRWCASRTRKRSLPWRTR